jgi:hypothetical protein
VVFNSSKNKNKKLRVVWCVVGNPNSAGVHDGGLL